MPRYDIFISYARKDSDVVIDIYQYLMARGVECFIDIENIFPGDNYIEVEKAEMAKCQKVVLFFSNHCYDDNQESVLRPNIYKELKMAKDLNKIILPIILDGTDYSGSESVMEFLENIDYYRLDPSSQKYGILLRKINKGIKLIHYKRDAVLGSFSDLEQRANEGDVEAQKSLGDFYRLGKKIEINYNKAIDWYKKAAEQKDESTYSYLGACHLGAIKPHIEKIKADGIDSATARIFRNEVFIYHKRSEHWYRRAAKSSTKDFSGLLDLFEENCLWAGLFYLLPDKETFEVFKEFDGKDESVSYRLCRLLSSIILIDHFDDASIGLKEKARKALNILNESRLNAYVLLKYLADRGIISAILFLASVEYHRQTPTLQEQDRIDKVVGLLNDSYQIAGDDLFK